MKMNSNEINLFASRLNISNFCGVFGLDELKQIDNQHWIALSVSADTIFYFDSLNSGFHSNECVAKFLIKMNKNVILNNIQIQPDVSNLCGLHCIVFCHLMSENNTLPMFQSFMKTISQLDVLKREQLSLLLAPLSGALAVHMVCDPSNPSHPIQHVAFECSQLFLIVQSVSRQPSPAQPSPAQPSPKIDPKSKMTQNQK